ncbi:MAG: hypothetical protein WDW36_006766 [Sanguina aurantia]
MYQGDPDPGCAAAALRPSRGALTTDFLHSSLSPEAYVKTLDLASFSGFNLVLVDLPSSQLWYCNNAAAGNNTVVQQLRPSVVYGLSNGCLNEWPKVVSGVELVSSILQHAAARSRQSGSADEEDTGVTERMWQDICLGVMGDCEKVVGEGQGGDLPTSLTAADFPKHQRYICSSRFIEPVPSPWGMYGTRSQMLLTVASTGQCKLRERYLEGGEWREVEHCFQQQQQQQQQQ